jgi:hypothetical protein
MSGTGGRRRSDGEYSVIEGIDVFRDVMVTGVNVAREGNASTPRLASAGNFWKGRYASSKSTIIQSEESGCKLIVRSNRIVPSE